MKDYHETNYVQECPLCGAVHESKDHEVGRNFPCCPHRLLVWVDKGNRLELEIVPDEEDKANAP